MRLPPARRPSIRATPTGGAFRTLAFVEPALSASRALAFFALAFFVAPAAARAQLPTTPTTGVPTPPDSVAGAPRDSVQQVRPPSDTIPAADTLPAVDAPPLRSGPPAGFATQTFTWNRDQLMGLRDLTLIELLETIPGVTPLRGGDYGAPEAASAQGMAGGRVRVFFDGFEQLALDGGAPDLALVGLAGVEAVTVERGPDELRIELYNYSARDPRALSLFEAGTGDAQTNFFRGTFQHPRVLGGVLGLSLERVDTRGPFRREPGHRTSGWLSFGRPLGDALWLRVEAHLADRDVDLSAFPIGFDRRDWAARLRGRFLDDRLVAEAFTGSSLLKSDDLDFVPIDRSRGQHGVRLSWDGGTATVGGSFRKLGGPGLPSTALEGEASLAAPIGGAFGRVIAERWPGRSNTSLALSAWTAPAGGLSAFASLGSGTHGAAVYPDYVRLPADEEAPVPVLPEPTSRASELTTLRVGGAFERGLLRLEGAWLSLDADSLPPMGTALDRHGPTAPGGTFQGVEAQARFGRLDGGLSLSGWVQRWGTEARYLPNLSYQAALEYHQVFRETRNLELWSSAGVRGRDDMLVPNYEAPEEGPATLARVPSGYSAWLDVQVRIVTVHIFIRWENFTYQQNLQDYPERVLPYTRSVYGLRWIMFN